MISQTCLILPGWIPRPSGECVCYPWLLTDAPATAVSDSAPRVTTLMDAAARTLLRHNDLKDGFMRTFHSSAPEKSGKRRHAGSQTRPDAQAVAAFAHVGGSRSAGDSAAEADAVIAAARLKVPATASAA